MRCSRLSSYVDQLNQILYCLGTPSEDTLRRVGSPRGPRVHSLSPHQTPNSVLRPYPSWFSALLPHGSPPLSLTLTPLATNLLPRCFILTLWSKFFGWGGVSSHFGLFVCVLSYFYLNHVLILPWIPRYGGWCSARRLMILTYVSFRHFSDKRASKTKLKIIYLRDGLLDVRSPPTPPTIYLTDGAGG